ncbi:hypothetical protein [Salmonirosea aquatica]|uniref:Uncharacterized protein n=1 Tax=Salmonirosea aquatica TaxID=2654236 RepID=A0A7C9BKS3_9BACT|nr:hypothetical protein [Cytophagaceae bacterium SJW1-29]
MKNILYLTCLGFTFLLFTCKKPDVDAVGKMEDLDEVAKIEGTSKVDSVKNLGWLKNVKVEGATEVAFDTVERTIAITLPATFTKDTLFLDFELYEGATLELNSWHKLITANRIELSHFRGNSPTTFMVLSQDKRVGKTYMIYVECTGPLNASLTSDLMLHPSRAEPYSSVQASLELNSGVGTIPEKPGSTKRLTSKLIDLGSGRPVQGMYGVPVRTFFLENTTPLNLASEYALELEYGEKKFVSPIRKKLVRATPIAAPYELNSLFQALPLNREILLDGGYFLSDLNYRIKVESDFHPSMWLAANYKNPSMLSFVLPSETADGSYLISLYEGESLVKSFIFNVSNAANTKGIRKILAESLDCPSRALREATPRNLTFQKGQAMYVDPFPAILGGFYASFDPNKKLPDLELKNGQRSVILKAKTRADGCYADGTVQLYYGEYMIPTSMAPGSYEARLVYPEDPKSVPFWTLITIH